MFQKGHTNSVKSVLENQYLAIKPIKDIYLYNTLACIKYVTTVVLGATAHAFV